MVEPDDDLRLRRPWPAGVVTDASGRTTTMAYDRRGQLTETVRDPQVNGGSMPEDDVISDRDGASRR
jgi:hypothetical protein